MSREKIAAVVGFCSNDYRFLSHQLASLGEICDQVVVVTCDHFFDGTLENYPLLYGCYQKSPHIDWVEFAYEKNCGYGPLAPAPDDPGYSFYWHSVQRYIGALHVKRDIPWILYLDMDEYFDPDRFLAWWNGASKKRGAYKFASYFYMREYAKRAISHQSNALLIHQMHHRPFDLLDVAERWGVFQKIRGPKSDFTMGRDHKPLIHHFSWVRTIEEAKRKARCWGHRNDKEWEILIEQEWSSKSSRNDPLYSLQYESVKAPIDPLTLDPSRAYTSSLRPEYVRCVPPKTVERLHIEKLLLDEGR